MVAVQQAVQQAVQLAMRTHTERIPNASRFISINRERSAIRAMSCTVCAGYFACLLPALFSLTLVVTTPPNKVFLHHQHGCEPVFCLPFAGCLLVTWWVSANA